MTKSRGILPPRKRWSAEELDMLRRDYPKRRADRIAADIGVKIHLVYAMAHRLGLHKSPEFLSSEQSGRTSALRPRGVGNRFQKGWPSARKGQAFPTRGRMGLTQFKTGNRPHNARFQIGDRRINSLGYLDRKISTDKRGGLNWTAEHRLVWIAANGPLPTGHVVVFKAGCRTTELSKITLDALELVTNEEHMRRHSYHNNYPKKVGELIQLKGAITRQINKRERESHEKQD